MGTGEPGSADRAMERRQSDASGEMTKRSLRRIASVSAEAPYRLRIVWRDGGIDTVDMTRVIRGQTLFAPLLDPAVFGQVEVIDHGSGIEWINGIDYSADSLAQLAAYQSKETSRT